MISGLIYNQKTRKKVRAALNSPIRGLLSFIRKDLFHGIHYKPPKEHMPLCRFIAKDKKNVCGEKKQNEQNIGVRQVTKVKNQNQKGDFAV